MFHGVFSVLILATVVSGTLQLNISSDPPTTPAITVAWTRSGGDPTTFLLKLFPGQSNKQVGESVNVNATQKSGTTSVPVKNLGQYQVFAVDPSRDGDVAQLQNTKVFTVSKPVPPSPSDSPFPTSSTDSGDVSPGSGNTTSASTPLISESAEPTGTTIEIGASATPDDSSTSSFPTPSLPSPHDASGTELASPKAPSRNSQASKISTPVIVGAVIGGVVGLSAIAFLLYKLVFQRRRKRQRPASFHRDMMVRTTTPGGSYSAGSASPFSALLLHDHMKGSPRSSRTSLSLASAQIPPTRRGSTVPFGYDNDLEKAYHFPSLSEAPPRISLTERQMVLQGRILDLQAKMIPFKDERHPEFLQLRKKVQELEALQTGDWARELTDIVPSGVS